MASFKTAFNSVSHGPDEFTAVDGVVEIPDEQVAHFADFIASGELAPVEATTDAPADASGEDASESDKSPSEGDKPKRKKG